MTKYLMVPLPYCWYHWKMAQQPIKYKRKLLIVLGFFSFDCFAIAERERERLRGTASLGTSIYHVIKSYLLTAIELQTKASVIY